MGNYDFRNVEEAVDLSEHAHSVDARLIVIDALADVMVGGDENSVLSTQPILRNLRALAIDCDAAVVIVHHNNKSGAFRGSTTLQAAVDHMLSVYSPPGQNLIHYRFKLDYEYNEFGGRGQGSKMSTEYTLGVKD